MHYTKPPEVNRAWPAYIVRRGPYLVRLVFSDEKACPSPIHRNNWTEKQNWTSSDSERVFWPEVWLSLTITAMFSCSLSRQLVVRS